MILNIARALWGFNITQATDTSGKPIEIDIVCFNLLLHRHLTDVPDLQDAFSNGFNSQPLDFACEITVRSAKHKEVIEADWTDALDGLKQYTW